MRAPGLSSRRVPLALIVLAATACAAIVALTPRDGLAAEAVIVASVCTAAGAAGILGEGRQRQTSAAWLHTSLGRVPGAARPVRWRIGAAVWAVVIIAVAASDVVAFVGHRNGDPTLSRLIGHLSVAPAGRGLLLVCWLSWGAWGVLGRRASP
jgi:hypothetical protein